MTLVVPVLGAVKFVGAAAFYPNATSSSVIADYTTEVVTAITTYCPAATTLTFNDKTYTVTSATTLTITDCPCTISKPATPKPVPANECVQTCYDAYNKCRGQPDPNFSTCAAEYSACLGYNPFNGNGSLVTPTACSSQPPAATTPILYTTKVLTAITTYCPAPTTLSYNDKTYVVTEPTHLTITDCPCTVSAPVTPTAVVPTPPSPDCPQNCSDAYNQCRGQPNANRSTCASEYASCLGYNPFAQDGSLVTPTACSASVATAGVTSTTSPGPDTVATAAAERIIPANVFLALGVMLLI